MNDIQRIFGRFLAVGIGDIIDLRLTLPGMRNLLHCMK